MDSLVIVKKGADTLYTASGFKVYVGQQLKIGVGSTPDGDFKYIRRSATSLFNYYSTTGYNALANSANALPRSLSGHQYEVLRIDKRGNKKNGFVYYPILKQIRYEIDMDNAISFGEIVVPDEFKPKPKSTVIEVKQSLSVADEIAKLKKLRDDSVITNEEFESQKKKLLGEK